MHQLSNTPRGVSLEGVKQFLLNTKLNQNIFLVALLLDDILKFFWRLRCWTAFCISDDIYIYNVNLKNKIYKSNKRPCWTASCISNIIYIRTFRMLDSIMQKNAAVQQLYIRTFRMLDSIMQKNAAVQQLYNRTFRMLDSIMPKIAAVHQHRFRRALDRRHCKRRKLRKGF